MTTCSIHTADNGLWRFFRSQHPDPSETPGLLSSQRLTAAGFSGRMYPGAPQLSRNGFIAFWEDDAAVSAFLDSAAGESWCDAWHVRTTPTRAVGRWPGLPTDIDRDVKTTSDHPVIGVSLGPLRLGRGFTFNKLNTRVEAQLREFTRVLWASAFFAPPRTLCTVTFWESAAALHSFARSGAHAEAMKASLDPGFDPSLPNGTNFFAPDSVFMSLNPYAVSGSLSGKNPLPAGVFGALDSAEAKVKNG
ncbi:MAG: hypothetical protein HKN24_15260 [Acidimicrobiales bacterium]|nr:hypothetical protein [Acidimicrobiales bacterium]